MVLFYVLIGSLQKHADKSWKCTNIITDFWIIDHYNIQSIWVLKVVAMVVIDWSDRYVPHFSN